MGIFSRLLGVDQMNAAINAVLAQHAMDTIPVDELERMYGHLLVTVLSGAPAHLDAGEVCRMANRAGRIAQLNLLAMTMANLDMTPMLNRGVWQPFVRNPFEPVYSSPAVWERVRAVEDGFSRRHSALGYTFRMPTEGLQLFNVD